MPDATTQTVLFDISPKSVVVKFDQAHSSSDGGALPLKAVGRTRRSAPDFPTRG